MKASHVRRYTIAWCLLFLSLFSIRMAQAEPIPRVKWSGEDFRQIQIWLDGEDELMDRCLNSGFTLHYRYFLQLCKRSGFWFDSCNDERQIRHSMSVDPLSESYSFESDRYGDIEGPQTVILTERTSARQKFRTLESVALSFLSDKKGPLSVDEDTYVSVRVISHCEGEVNRTLSRISSFLTLGLVRISGFNTGWVDFILIQVPPTITDETG